MRYVLLVPGMTRNLTEVSTLEDEGYDVIFSKGRVFIQKYGSNMKIEMGIHDGGLYKLTARLLKALLHDTISSVELWHRKLTHLHYRALPSLKKVVTSLLEFKVQHDGVFQGCALGKNVKKSFPDSDSRAKGILDLIHSYLCAPMSVATQSGHLYFMTFIDDYSRKTKESDEVLDRF